MAKKEKKKICAEMPPWMITFSDVMTLMLTFFVLLVSMSKIDDRRKLVVLGSIIGTFGWNDASYENFSKTDTARTVEPGPIEAKDLEPLKPLLWENAEDDLNFESNKFIQILSINAKMLFAPGSSELSEQGRAFLDSLMPVLANVQYPLLLAGHTSELRDERGMEYHAEDRNAVPDLTWKISLARTLSVYRYMLAAGIRPEMLKVEAFGRFMPKYATQTAESRAKNRRVDIVLDKRSVQVGEQVRELTPEEKLQNNRITVDGFEFDLRAPGLVE